MADQAPHLSWFPFYPGDYLRDTSRLSTVQHGAFVLLLLDYYSTGGPLPLDMEEVYRIARADSQANGQAIREAISQVVARFFVLRDDGWHNLRADREIAKRISQRERLSEAGKLGGKRRWNQEGTDGQASSQAIGQAIDQAIARPQPQPQPQKEKKEELLSGKPDDAPSDPTENGHIPYAEIIGCLNEHAETQFRSTTAETQRCIRARWNAGFRLEDFERVIRQKVAAWKEDPKMIIYLRPQTLFGTKFEAYLNEPEDAGGTGRGPWGRNYEE